MARLLAPNFLPKCSSIMVVFGVLLGLLTFLVYIWYNGRKRTFEFFKNIGVDGPSPNLFFGNMKEMKEGVHEKLEKWRKQYGKTFGYFEGPKPILVTSDVEILKHVLISDFARFNNRKDFPLHDDHDKFEGMFTAKGQQWKRLRSISSPSFSTKRMKEMSPLINDSISQLMECFELRHKEGNSFDIYGDFQKLTLSAIAASAFGIEINTFKDPNHIFLQKTRRMFKYTEEENRPFLLSHVILPLAICFPGVFHKFWHFAKAYVDLPQNWFLGTSKKILEHRMKVKSDRIDFLKLMLDAGEEDMQSVGDLSMTLDDKATKENTNPPEKSIPTEEQPKASQKKMKMEEMQAQSMLFLLAGYETTSTALGYTSYLLALHPRVQQKLLAEIDEHFPDKERVPDFASVQKLPYMDMVIYEVLRMYPIAQIATTRVAAEDCVIGRQRIPKGLIIQAHMAAIHRDPDLWGPEDPDDFLPERFLPERKAQRHMVAWMPFGVGPRNCVGMRFGLLEIKLTLVRMLKKYTVERCEETKVPLPLNKITVVAPSQGVFVKLVKRE